MEIRKAINKFVLSQYDKGFEHNEDNILQMFSDILSKLKRSRINLLDVGCGDGRLKVDILSQIPKANISHYGIEGRSDIAMKARKLGVKVKVSDLRRPFPFRNKFFDIIHGDQVIEHILNKDAFLEKCHSKLRDNGFLIISTENLSSVDNIMALILGFEPFSQHLSMRYFVGNPLSPHCGESLSGDYEDFGHKMIGTYSGLVDLLKRNGFKVIKIAGAGYFPLPERLSSIDPRHSRFITILAKKRR